MVLSVVIGCGYEFGSYQNALLRGNLHQPSAAQVLPPSWFAYEVWFRPSAASSSHSEPSRSPTYTLPISVVFALLNRVVACGAALSSASAILLCSLLPARVFF